jgi:hypothetical protein
VWLEESPCGGITPACVNGVCASVKLVGGLLSIGTTSGGESARLVDHGFESLELRTGELDNRGFSLIGALRP